MSRGIGDESNADAVDRMMGEAQDRRAEAEQAQADHNAVSGSNYASYEDVDDLKVQHDATRKLLARSVKSMGDLTRQHETLLLMLQDVMTESGVLAGMILRLRWQILCLWVLVGLLTAALIVVVA